MVGQTPAQSKQEVFVAGIDPSLDSTGVCVLCPETDPILELIRFPHLRGARRLVAIRNAVAEVLKKYTIRLAAIEGYSYNSVGRWFDLGELGGVIKVELLLCEIETLTVAPKSLKKFVTNNGQANKTRMIREVNQRYCPHKCISNDNLADALGLARFAYVAYTGDSSRRCELEAVKKACAKKGRRAARTYKKFWVEI